MTLEKIARASAAHFGVKLKKIRGHSRKKSLVRARHVAMYCARWVHDAAIEAGKPMPRFSYKDIGAYFGGRNHATVIHAVLKVSVSLGDAQMSSDTEAVDERLKWKISNP